MPQRKLKQKNAINDTKMIRDNPNKLRDGWVRDLQSRRPKIETRTNE